MIDFRYHLVSIVAVFLALAIGIIIGVEGVSPRLADKLTQETKQVAKEQKALNAQNSRLRSQLAVDSAFGGASSRLLLTDLLQGQRVVLVLAPGADTNTVKGISTALGEAGATITGQVQLQPQFFDPSQGTEQTLTNLARSMAPAGITLPSAAAAAHDPGQQAAAKVIAATIMDKNGVATLTAQQSQKILAGFAGQGFLQIAGPTGGQATLPEQATLAVIVSPASQSAGASDNDPLIAIAQYLQQMGNAAVLAGTVQSSGPGSAINEVATGAAGVAVSTVDFADSQIGQIVVAWALRKLLDPHAKPAGYGLSTGNVPRPAPSTAPTPSVSSTSPANPKHRSPR